ncbi:MAG: hypothetical protein MZV63_14735 [Marinilabiliales bacterium]|nr:hypothetical protein [Marinilabiliales bacterium]
MASLTSLPVPKPVESRGISFDSRLIYGYGIQRLVRTSRRGLQSHPESAYFLFHGAHPPANGIKHSRNHEA